MVAKVADGSFPYEFGGPIGTLLNIMLLPVLTLLLVHWSHVGYVDLGMFTETTDRHNFWKSPALCRTCGNDVLLLKCSAGVLLWFLFQVALERMLPCKLVLGTPVGPEKKRLSYRINGHLAFWVSLLFVRLGTPSWHEESGYVQFKELSLSFLYDLESPVAVATVALCFVLSLTLYATSFVGTKILAAGGNSGNPVYDFWVGRELNPRTGSFDWKEFCELRPGLIGWMLLNIACMEKQHDNLGYVTGSMMLVTFFQGLYVWDALYQEEAILTTMDITTDGFGFMLVFGDMAWVPFTYSIQARFLVYHDPHLPALGLLAIVAIHGIGYVIFRGANGQKDAFRKCQDEAEMERKGWTYLATKRGTKLLTSGWWGAARKINYTGDWIMGLSWCLVCGFGSIVPYFYAVYFLVLLIHRSLRDDALCQAKYGKDWDKYKEMVPCVFVPGLY